MEITKETAAHKSQSAIGAIDIGGTKIAVGIVTNTGSVIERTVIPVQVAHGPADAFKRISKIMDDQRRKTASVLRGIGIGCTGPVDPLTGALQEVNTLPGWCGWNPVHQLAERFSVPVALENDADAVALAIARHEPEGMTRTLVCVTVGTGIGVGIVQQGHLYRGAAGSHPEPGHHIIEPDGPECTCGASGCWEALAAGPALETWFASRVGMNSPTVTSQQICDMARAGDASALESVARQAEYLGRGVANLVSMFMPDAVVLSGSVMESADLFLATIRQKIQENCRMVPLHLCEIRTTHLGADVGLIGAAEVWRHRYEIR